MLSPCNEAALASIFLQIVRVLNLNEIIDDLVQNVIISFTEMETINADLRVNQLTEANRYLLCCISRKNNDQFQKFVDILCEKCADIGQALMQAIEEHRYEPQREETTTSDVDVQSVWAISEQGDNQDPNIVAVLEQDNEELRRDLQDVEARLDASRVESERLKTVLEQDNSVLRRNLQDVQASLDASRIENERLQTVLEQDNAVLRRNLQEVQASLDASRIESERLQTVLEQDNEELQRNLQDVQASLDASRIESEGLQTEMLGAVASNEFEGNWEWPIDGTQWKQLLDKEIEWIGSPPHRAPACVGGGMMRFSIRSIKWDGTERVLLSAYLTKGGCNADLNYPQRMWIRRDRWDNDEKKYVYSWTGGVWFDGAGTVRPIASPLAPNINSPPRYRLSFSPA